MPQFNLSGTPTGKRILVFPDSPEEWSPGGVIYIPEEARDIPMKGRILQVGPEVNICYPGEEVIYGKYAGTNLEFTVLVEGAEKKIPCILMLDSDLLYIWPTAEGRLKDEPPVPDHSPIKSSVMQIAD
jgi:co-chaperonin GroES (HSP10)